MERAVSDPSLINEIKGGNTKHFEELERKNEKHIKKVGL